MSRSYSKTLLEDVNRRGLRGVYTTSQQVGIPKQPELTRVTRGSISPEAGAFKDRRDMLRSLQNTALGAGISPGGSMGSWGVRGPGYDALKRDAYETRSIIRDYFDNAKKALKVPGMSNSDFNREYGRIDYGDIHVLEPAMDFAKAKRLKQDLPRQSEDDIFGPFADRKAKADAARKDYYRSGRGSQTSTTPTTSSGPLSSVTKTVKDTVKNIDPKLAAILAGGAGVAALTAVAANKLRKKKKKK